MRLLALLLVTISLFVIREPLSAQVTVETAGGKLDQGLTVVMSYGGFFVKRLDIKSGRVGMLIQNRSGLTNLTFQLTRDEDSAALLTSKHSAKQRDNILFFSIKPGVYRLSVVEQPSWHCVLNVSGS